MPQNLKQKVQRYAPTLPSSDAELDEWLYEAYMDVLGELPEHCQRHMARRVTVPAGGLTLNGKIVLEAYDRDERRTVAVDATVRDLMQDRPPESAYWTGAVRYVEAGVLYVHRYGDAAPSQGTALCVEVPQSVVSHQQITIDGAPPQATPLVVLKTAIRLKEKDLRTLRTNLPSDLTNVAVPVAPSSAALTYTPAAASAVASSTLGSLGTAPTYTAPATTLAQGDIVAPTLDLSGVTVPTAPAASAGVAALPALTPFSDLGPLVLSWENYDAYYAEEDPEIMRTEIQRKRAEIEDYQQQWQNEVAVWQAAFDEWQKSVDVLIVEGQMTDTFELNKYATEVQAYRAEIQSLIDAHAQNLARVVEIFRNESESDVAIYRAQVDNAAAEVQADIATYQGTVQGALAQLQTDLAEAQLNAKQSTDVDVVNKAKALEADIQEAILILQRYQAQIAAYSAEVAGQRSVFDSILEKFKVNTATLRANIRTMKEEYAERFYAYTMNRANGTHTHRHHTYTQV